MKSTHVCTINKPIRRFRSNLPATCMPFKLIYWEITAINCNLYIRSNLSNTRPINCTLDRNISINHFPSQHCALFSSIFFSYSYCHRKHVGYRYRPGPTASPMGDSLAFDDEVQFKRFEQRRGGVQASSHLRSVTRLCLYKARCRRPFGFNQLGGCFPPGGSRGGSG